MGFVFPFQSILADRPAILDNQGDLDIQDILSI